MKKVVAFILSMLMILTLAACSKNAEASIYKGIGKGNNGDIEVEVSLSGNEITKVEVINHSETPGLSDKPLEEIPNAIVEQQTTKVDTISGATNTSIAIIEAVENALESAEFNLADSNTSTEKSASAKIPA